MTEAEDRAVKALIIERDELKDHCRRLQSVVDAVGYAPGHYYSPIVDINDGHVIRAVQERLRSGFPAGVAVNPEAMKEMLMRLAGHHSMFCFPRDPGPKNRFYLSNPFFGCHDASIYFSILMEFRPRRVVEIGSGFSSRLLLDTAERFLGSETQITLIDPSLDASMLRTTVNTETFVARVQDVPMELFTSLEENDILFIDSSHVCKTASDVNFYMFEILPALKPGVLIHIHDIFWPFEYLASWLLDEKRFWNETYVVRAFLQYNTEFKIIYWNNYAFHSFGAELRNVMPLCMENEGGSLWITRVSAS